MRSGRFDYDWLVIGSGFGGSVAALRAAEKGYRVGVMESGRRWRDEDIPKTSLPSVYRAKKHSGPNRNTAGFSHRSKGLLRYPA